MKISFSQRGFFVALSLLATFGIMQVLPNVWGIQYTHYFPLGLFAIFIHFGLDENGWMWTFLFVGWIIYISIFTVLLRQVSKVKFFKVFGVLCFLLVVNMVGCQKNMF